MDAMEMIIETETIVEADKSIPGMDYLWYDMTGDSLDD